ncbi:MAG: hypothetical protein IH594_16240 [Bacteroidales bacterium]|nr:hypothetical protein [Bacteroidales bacterium]
MGGACLLPEKQYFTEIAKIPADRVAAYSKLKEAGDLRIFSDEKAENTIELSVSDTILYDEIHYEIQMEGKPRPLKAGYYIHENNEGTELLWYLELDSLRYPHQRWEGFLAPFIYRNKIRQVFVKLEKDISK